MTLYVGYALLIALFGAETFFVLRGTHFLSESDKGLREAARYTVIDATPKDSHES
ncbi:MAG TPA: hypothetical protein VJ837_02415 [Candidatus Paceibacterota bacterium]|nr:hypothetical protein [Candidatus Paceibacterota bacterium]